jgi:hypothetical protein
MIKQKVHRWAIGIMRGSVETLAIQDPIIGPMLGMNRVGMEMIMNGMVRDRPELEGKLRLVPVVVEIREMTAEEEARFRERP